VPRQTDTPPPPPPAAVETPPAPAPPPADAAVDPAKRAACEGYVAILSGRKQDPAALDKPDLQAIATADLVMCGAVRSDSDVMCKRLMPVEHGPSAACLQMQAIFHELRTYPGKHSFMFDDFDWNDCHGVPALATYCDTLRAALRSGNASDCAQVGDGESICRAYMTVDKSLCHVTGKLAEVEIELPDRKKGEPAKVKVKEALEEGCRQNIESRAFLAKGLKALAESGPARERELAKAALQQADACETYAQAALQSCTGIGPTQAPGAADSNAPAPAPPAAGTPVSSGKSPPTGNPPPDAQGRG
jgi:hypothetical protein